MNVSEIFETMDYGPAPEGSAEAMAWLDGHGRKFGHFIGGVFTKPGRGFDSDHNALTVFWPDGSRELPLASKPELARRLVSLVAERFHAAGPA